MLRLLAAPEELSYEEIGAALGMPIGAIGPPAPGALINFDARRNWPACRPGSRWRESDELGRFRVRLATGGPIRLRVLGAEGNPPVETSWITV